MIDTRELRHCFGRFATGVTVVTYEVNDVNMGITANSFTSVSLDPPLLLIAIDRKANSCEKLRDRAFTVNMLSDKQVDIAWHFAGRQKEDLVIHWEKGSLAPRIKEGTLGWLECKPWRSYDGGDHVLYLGEILEFQYYEGNPLIFFTGKMLSLSGHNSVKSL